MSDLLLMCFKQGVIHQGAYNIIAIILFFCCIIVNRITNEQPRALLSAKYIYFFLKNIIYFVSFFLFSFSFLFFLFFFLFIPVAT